MGDYVHVIILTICGFWCIINKNISYNTIRFSFFNEKNPICYRFCFTHLMCNKNDRYILFVRKFFYCIANSYS